jgi:hypothetical protein
MAALAIHEHLFAQEPSDGAEPLALANLKVSSGSGARAASTNTLSVRHSAPPPNVIVAKPTTTRPGVAATTMRNEPRSSTAVEEQRDVPIGNVVRRPDPTPLDYWFDVRQQWEGVVTSVGGDAGDEFTVVLRDVSHADAPEYEAVLSMEEISEDDLPLLKEGAVLYWTIGYKTRAGTRERVSTIRLRRLPAWSRADIKRVQRRAQELDELFKSE